MRFAHKLLSFALALAVPVLAQTNYTTNVTLTSLQSGSGPVANAQVCAIPADDNGNPITISAPTWGLMLPYPAKCATVTAGALPSGLNVPDASHTNLGHAIKYNFIIQQLSPSGSPIGPPARFLAVPNVTGTTFALDTYTPAVSIASPAASLVGYGVGVPTACSSPSIWTSSDTGGAYVCQGGTYKSIAGAPGAAGAPGPPTTFKGTYNASTTYNAGDAVAIGGSSYVSLTSGNTANAPPASPSQWALLAAAGTVTPTQAVSISQASSGDALQRLGYTGPLNLFPPSSTLTLGGIGPDGNPAAINYLYASDYLYVAGQSVINGNTAQLGGCGDHATAFYDFTKALLGTWNYCDGGVHPNGYSVPPGSVWMRTNLSTSEAANPSAVVLVGGATLPTTAPPYLYPDSSYIAGLRTVIPTPASYSQSVEARIQTSLEAVLPGNRNLFDQTKFQAGFDYNNLTNTLRATGSYQGVTGPIGAVPGKTYSVCTPANGGQNPNEGGLFLDALMNPIWPSFQAQPWPANYQMIAPSNAAYLEPMLQTPNIGTAMVVQGTTCPTYYIPFARPPPTSQTLSPWNGKKLAIFGDSYSAMNIWQQGVAAIHGMTITFQDARSSRPFGGAGNTAGQGIFECYGGDPINGTNQGAALTPQAGYGTCAAANNGTVGHTLTQDLAAAAPDLIIIQLGGNDYGDPALGSISDPATAQTTYGFIKTALNGVHAVIAAANLDTRVACMEPIEFGDQSVGTTGYSRAAFGPLIAAAMEQVCAQYGDPVIKAWSESGINTSNQAKYLDSILIHVKPPYWQQIFIPYVAAKVQNITPMN